MAHQRTIAAESSLSDVLRSIGASPSSSMSADERVRAVGQSPRSQRSLLMTWRRALVGVLILAIAVAALEASSAATPAGQMTWAVHVSLAPTWFDPAETPGIATPFMVLYALHDGMVKPMPGNAMAPGLAESWSASKDGLVYEFVLRQAARFHNGDPVTADDVKFSFE